MGVRLRPLRLVPSRYLCFWGKRRLGVRMRPDSYPVATVFMCFGGERRLGLRLRPDSYPVAVDVFLW